MAAEEKVNDDLSSKISQRSAKNFIPLVEDVAEWLSQTFKRDITVDNIFDELDDGVLICNLAERIQKCSELFCSREKLANIEPVPSLNFKCHKSAQKESFLARENAANFIGWCKKVGIQESILFESEGLVLQRQQKNVILTLLELGRIADKYGMNPVPNLIKLEREITEEEEKKPPKSPKQRAKKYVDEVDEQVQRIACKYHVELSRVKEGKYILDEKMTIFIRILRRHVMVRVGGGWDEFEHFLSRHDTKKIGKVLLSI